MAFNTLEEARLFAEKHKGRRCVLVGSDLHQYSASHAGTVTGYGLNDAINKYEIIVSIDGRSYRGALNGRQDITMLFPDAWSGFWASVENIRFAVKSKPVPPDVPWPANTSVTKALERLERAAKGAR